MSGPMPGLMQDDERARLKAAGFTDAEIDAELGAAKPSRPPVRVASESTAMQGPGKAPQRAATDLKTAIGTARSLAQGATFGFGDEIEAGARSLAGAPYKTTRDQIRGEQAAYVEAHPVAAIGAELAGGLLTGGAALKAAQGAGKIGAVVRASQLVPKVAEGAGVGSRVLAAARSGATAGALMGAGDADELSDVPKRAAIGYGVGGAGGAVAGSIAEAVRGARNLLGAAVKGDATAGRKAAIGQRVAMDKPVERGAQRVMNRVRASGLTLDELAAKEAAAPETQSLAEVLDDATSPSAWRKNQGTQGLRIGRNMGRERDAIDEGLQQRAADAPDRYKRAYAEASGVPEARDARAFAEEAMTAAQQEAGPLRDLANPRAIPDGAVAGVLDRVKKLQRQGLDLWGDAALADDAFPEAITDQLDVQQLRTLRQELDRNIAYGDDALNFGSIQRKANNRLKSLRDDIDGILKAAGGEPQREADRLVAEAAQKGESFKAGQKAVRATTREGMQAAQDRAADPEAFRVGVASDRLARIESAPDVTRLGNPTSATMGSPNARARSRMGLPDDAAAQRLQAEVDQIGKEFQTRARVSGNSTTFANASEGADEFGNNPAMWAQAIASPSTATMGLARRVIEKAGTATTAEQATEMARLLAAGLPGQMPRAEAIKRMQELLPAIEALMVRQAALRGQIGARGTQMILR